MSLFIASLNSGSSGNCYYVGNEQEAILVDAGISCREIEKRMSNLQLDISKVKAVFISHEHTDHIKGLDKLARKHNLPVYITPATRGNTRLALKKILLESFKADEPISIGNLQVIPFTKKHDAVDPYSFLIEHNGIRVGVITDIGIACKDVIRYFKQCHACFLESNYDDKMLDEGSYPPRLKDRIRGGHGHISNKQALELFLKHRPPFMSHLLLSHLSQNNNRPDLVEELFLQNASGTNIVVASRFKETDVYAIGGVPQHFPKIKTGIFKVHETVQMSLFE
ncbi:MBL fold metallo-hydrolase [soil metagenome]